MSFLMRIRQRFSAYRNFIPTLVAATLWFTSITTKTRKPLLSASHLSTRSLHHRVSHANQISSSMKSATLASRVKAPARGKVAIVAVPMHLSVAAIRVVLVTAKVTEDEVASAVVADAAEEENEENEVGEVDGEGEVASTTNLQLVATNPHLGLQRQHLRRQQQHRFSQVESLERIIGSAMVSLKHKIEGHSLLLPPCL